MSATVAWAIQLLGKESSSCITELVAETEYSKVHLISDGGSIFFLKQVPEKLYLEPKLTQYLVRSGCQCVPEIMGMNDELHCFLMRSAGELTLKQVCEQKFDGGLIAQNLSQYVQIQRTVEAHIDELLSLGVSDWRLDRIEALFLQMLSRIDELKQVGLTNTELKTLQELCPYVVEICAVLATYDIPQTINHCDFHVGNVIYDADNKKTTIIDWGEAVISHPFFSMCGYMWNLGYYFGKGDASDFMGQYLPGYLTAWLDCHDQQTLTSVFNHVDSLGALFAALSYDRLGQVANLEHARERRDYRVSVVECLKTFICKNRVR